MSNSRDIEDQGVRSYHDQGLNSAFPLTAGEAF